LAMAPLPSGDGALVLDSFAAESSSAEKPLLGADLGCRKRVTYEH